MSTIPTIPAPLFGPNHYPVEKMIDTMPAYPMGKMGNCPRPCAEGGPALAEGVFENQRKRGKEKEKKGKNRGKKGKKEIK